MLYQTTANNFQETAAMGELVSHIPELLVKKGWDTRTFIAQCMLAGMSQDTAYRLSKGETNFNAKTLRDVARVLGLSSISEVIDIAKNEH